LLARGVLSREYPVIAAGPSVEPRGGFLALLLIVAAIGGCSWAEQYRVPEGAPVDLARLPTSIAGWNGQDRPVPEGVTDMLKASQIMHRIYVSELGHEVAVYVMYWAPASTAAMHHPDVCMPLQGWDTASSRTWPIEYETGRAPLPVSMRTYTQSSYRQLVFYWAQVGNTVLPDGKEDGGSAYAHGWVIDMLTGQMGPPQTARLSVRVDMELIGDESRQAKVMSEITAALTREIYALLPWAAPGK
jgi:EpsI family protein